MTTGQPTVYLNAIMRFFQGNHDWENDSKYVVLLDSGYTPDNSHTTLADISAHEVSDPDYNPQDVTGATLTQLSDTVKFDCNDFNFGSSVTITGGRWAVILEGTVAGKSSGDYVFGYILLDNTPADVSTSSASFVIALGTAGLLQAGNGEVIEASGYSPFDLSEAQLTTQKPFFAWRAQPELVYEEQTGSYDTPVTASISDGDQVAAFLDAAVNVGRAYQTIATKRPKWETTPTGDGTQVLLFDGVYDEIEFEHSSFDAWEFLWDDVDKTLIFRLAFLTAPAGNRQSFAGALSGSTGRQWLIQLQTTEFLEYTIGNGGTYSTVDYDWGSNGFALNTMYTVAVVHTSGGTTSLYIDDFSSAVATDTITTWGSGSAARNTVIGARASAVDNANIELGGVVFLQTALTQSEIESWDTWIQEKSG